jgi:uncharacterized protein VirK/YbjX
MTLTFSAEWSDAGHRDIRARSRVLIQDLARPLLDLTALAQRPARALKLAMIMGMGAVHWRSALPLLIAPQGGALQRLVRDRPELWGSVMIPYLSRAWSVKTRFARIVDHCRTIERLGPDFDMAQDAEVEILDLSQLGSGYRVVLDQTRWMLRDGQLVLNLMHGDERLFSMAFCLSSSSGRTIAYVGALQGRQEEGVLDTYREFTKLAHGLRPRDFTIDVFRLLCQAIGVTQILAVSDKTRTAGVARISTKAQFEKVKLSYDEAWREKGGVLGQDGFFELPVAPARRSEAEMGKKRAMYRKRYDMLDLIQAALADRLAPHVADLPGHGPGGRRRRGAIRLGPRPRPGGLAAFSPRAPIHGR